MVLYEADQEFEEQTQSASRKSKSLWESSPLEWLQNMLPDLKLEKILKSGNVKSEYYLVQEGGNRIQLGRGTDIAQFGRVQAAIGDQSKPKFDMPRAKKTFGQWDKYRSAIVRAAEKISTVDNDSQDAEVREYIAMILETVSPEMVIDHTTPDGKFEICKPGGYAQDSKGAWLGVEGQVIIHKDSWISYLTDRKNGRGLVGINANELEKGLVLEQFRVMELQVKRDAKKLKKWVWVSPEGYYHRFFGDAVESTPPVTWWWTWRYLDGNMENGQVQAFGPYPTQKIARITGELSGYPRIIELPAGFDNYIEVEQEIESHLRDARIAHTQNKYAPRAKND